MTQIPYVLLLAALCAAVTSAHATPVVVPYYGATYGGQGGFSSADARRVVELLESIDRRVEAIEARQGVPLPVKKGLDPAAVAKVHCASCHTPAKADASGGGFVLFEKDGQSLRHLGAREKVRIAEAVQSGTMPPGDRKKLSADEKSAFRW